MGRGRAGDAGMWAARWANAFLARRDWGYADDTYTCVVLGTLYACIMGRLMGRAEGASPTRSQSLVALTALNL